MKILFLCVANSARSQMAEGLARFLFSDHAVVASAGSEPRQVNPLAIQAMANMGIDISAHESKSIAAVLSNDIDLVVTLCADEVCPVVAAGTKKVHWPFADPADARGSDEQRLAKFVAIRDQIRAKLIAFGEERSLLKDRKQL